MGAIREAVQALVDVIGEHTDLSPSGFALDPRHEPSTLIDRVFALDLQSVNTTKMRDRAHMDLEHTITVRTVIAVLADDQLRSQLDALDVEESVLDAVWVQSRLPAYRVGYLRTARRLSPSREYLYVDQVFTLAQSLSVES